MARSMSQQQQYNWPNSSFASSSRSNVQTTLTHNGFYQRPPPMKPVSTPNTMVEPSLARPQQLVQRHKESPATIDLTGSDDEEDDIMEISPNRFTSSSHHIRPTPSHRHSNYSMPGAYPGMPITPLGHANPNMMNGRARQQYGFMRGAQVAMQHALSGVAQASGNFAEPLHGLNFLFNGANSSIPLPVVRSHINNELVYGGTHPRPLGLDPVDPYAGQEDLGRHRFDVLSAHDPDKTKEEIEALLENIRPDEELPEHLRVHTPEAMAIELHKYQELGLTWLKNCEEGSNKGGILADDMGLGKTIQMLSLLVTRKSDDPRCKTTLIVAPVALMRQWKQEIRTRIKPGRHELTVFVHHGQTKAKRFSDLRNYDVVLTTYGSLAAELRKLEKFSFRRRNDHSARPMPEEMCVLIGEDARWYRVVLDEAQCIKNRNTQTAKAAHHLSATYRFCMTGTPMMNNVEELYSLIHFLRIKPYSSWEQFRMDFSKPLKQGNVELRDKSMRMLQTLCKAIMLRRTKQSTFEGRPILVLPERTTVVDNPQFDEDERSFYTALESRSQLQFNKYLKAGTVGKSYTAILVLLLRLRQACCHPHLIQDFGVSAAADLSMKESISLAEQLVPQVVARIKEKEGNFECPVCYDVSMNPSIFTPCGHDTCPECFTRLTDPANAVADGNENGGAKGKCPECRSEIDSKRVTDFDSFKKVHQPELLTAEERAELDPTIDALQKGKDSSEDEDSETSDDDDDDDDDSVDEKGNLLGFVADDGDPETDDVEAGADDIDRNTAGPSTARTETAAAHNNKKVKKSMKAKGKQKKKEKRAKTLSELKKEANKSAVKRKAYLRTLTKDWVSSAKLEKTLELLKQIMNDAEEEKVLIFSQWTSLLDLLEVPIGREGWGYRRYDGSMTPRMRGDAVDDFRESRKNVRIMLVSLKAGNAGLNLNMASQVIILDPFWNPYIEEQAIDRAHRLGQSRPVKVHRLLIEGTVEDRIIALQEKKRALISEALDEKAGQSIARLGVQELAYLFGVTRNPNQIVPYVPQEHRR